MAVSSEVVDATDALARRIRDGFVAYQTAFQTITRQARNRFSARDWHGMRADASERLSLYRDIVDTTEADLRARMGDRVDDRGLWSDLRCTYATLIADRRDAELAETFFNSITRRIFDTVGVDPKIEFVTADGTRPRRPPIDPVTHDFSDGSSTRVLLASILEQYAFDVPYTDPAGDAERTAAFIEDRLAARGIRAPISLIELADPVFYRGIGAYLVGRLFAGDAVVPLVLAFHHTDDGVMIDAVLLNEDDVSILFSFARSYFHVDVGHPGALVGFLKKILPRKRLAELYIAIGYTKHGKTELYRDLIGHFQNTTDAFERAPGKRGMVMTVFTMQSYDMVFKLIKDRFDPPKTATRKTVKERYHLVFKHDRAGRLVDAQEFEHLRLHRDLFSDALLTELLDIANDTVHLDGERVVVDHCYVERRVTPLDLYVRQRSVDEAKAALIEYGNAIKDLARTNIFPGDLLLKNFGVTRHGRVVFYDYDELGFVTDYTFRTKPQARSYMDEMSADAWFYVGPEDVFPEEFQVTMGVGDRLMEAFLDVHGDLFTAAYWQEVQSRLEAGTFLPILPYPAHDRLPERRDVTPEDLAAGAERKESSST